MKLSRSRSVCRCSAVLLHCARRRRLALPFSIPTTDLSNLYSGPVPGTATIRLPTLPQAKIAVSRTRTTRGLARACRSRTATPLHHPSGWTFTFPLATIPEQRFLTTRTTCNGPPRKALIHGRTARAVGYTFRTCSWKSTGIPRSSLAAGHRATRSRSCSPTATLPASARTPTSWLAGTMMFSNTSSTPAMLVIWEWITALVFHKA